MNNTKPFSQYRAARMCPVCGGSSKVRRSEELPDGTILRKRLCPACGHRFQTIERLLAE